MEHSSKAHISETIIILNMLDVYAGKQLLRCCCENLLAVSVIFVVQLSFGLFVQHSHIKSVY